MTSTSLSKIPHSLVNKNFESFPPLLDEILFKNPVVTPKRQLPLPRLARQGGHHNFTIPLELIPEPLEVAVPPPDARLFDFEYGQVRLKRAF